MRTAKRPPTGARMGAVSFIHRFGAALNPHTHYHCSVTDGVFSGDASGVHFHTSRLNTADIQQVQETVRQRTSRLFDGRGLLIHDEVEAMSNCSHGGGFSVDASVRIVADDRRGLGPGVGGGPYRPIGRLPVHTPPKNRT